MAEEIRANYIGGIGGSYKIISPFPKAQQPKPGVSIFLPHITVQTTCEDIQSPSQETSQYKLEAKNYFVSNALENTSQNLPIYMSAETTNRKIEDCKMLMYIFNHFEYNDKTIGKRYGTDKDVNRLIQFAEYYTKIKLGDDQIYHDLTYAKILTEFKRIGNIIKNNKNIDALTICILTHGKDQNILEAIDCSYDFNVVKNALYEYAMDSTMKKQRDLKIFNILVACKGTENTASQQVNIDAGARKKKTPDQLPNFPCYNLYSTLEGYISERNEIDGTPFINKFYEVTVEDIKKEGHFHLPIKDISQKINQKYKMEKIHHLCASSQGHHFDLNLLNYR